MGVIKNTKWLDDFYDQRPQLVPPPKTVLGYLVGDKIKPAIESLLNIANHTTVEADAQKLCEFCGETSCKNAECEDDY